MPTEHTQVIPCFLFPGVNILIPEIRHILLTETTHQFPDFTTQPPVRGEGRVPWFVFPGLISKASVYPA